MKTIKMLKDINKLEIENLINKSLGEHMRNYFFELSESLSNEESVNEFSLEEYGYIVLLEKNDDIRNLEEVGLNKSEDGLLGVIPEWVELKKLKDNSCIYQIGVLCNNEYMMIFYTYLGTFDKEVEQWLKDQI